MKQLIRIDDETNLNKENSEIWVSHAALNKALDASPTFHTVSTVLTNCIRLMRGPKAEK